MDMRGCSDRTHSRKVRSWCFHVICMYAGEHPFSRTGTYTHSSQLNKMGFIVTLLLCGANNLLGRSPHISWAAGSLVIMDDFDDTRTLIIGTKVLDNDASSRAPSATIIFSETRGRPRDRQAAQAGPT